MHKLGERLIPQTTLRDVATILFKHKQKIVVFFIVVIFTVTLGTFLMPEVYESEAKIFIRIGRESVSLDPTATNAQTVNITQNLENQINSEIELIKSKELAKKVVRDLGVERFKNVSSKHLAQSDAFLDKFRLAIWSGFEFPKRAIAGLFQTPSKTHPDSSEKQEKLAKQIIKNLSVEAVQESQVITMAYEAHSPQLSRNVLDRLISHFNEKHLDVHKTPGSFIFFKNQKLAFSEKLAKTEQKLSALKNEIGLSSLQEQRRILTDQIGNLRNKIEENEAQLASSLAKVDSLNQQLINLPETVVTSKTTGLPLSTAEEMHKRLYELKLKEQELLSTFTEQSIPVREVQRQISKAENMLQVAGETQQVTRGISETHQNLSISLQLEKSSLASLRAKSTALNKQMQIAMQRLKELNKAETRLARLKRIKGQLKENYHKYSESLEQARIDQALEMEKISNISVAQAPMLPVDPIRPMTTLNLGLGFFLALFGSLGLAFCSEYLDNTLQKPEQVERVLGLPVLGSVGRGKKHY